jgi:hypothetical protein
VLVRVSVVARFIDVSPSWQLEKPVAGKMRELPVPNVNSNFDCLPADGTLAARSSRGTSARPNGQLIDELYRLVLRLEDLTMTIIDSLLPSRTSRPSLPRSPAIWNYPGRSP